MYYSKQHEIEAIIEDLIENTIIDTFASSFSSKKECEIALDVLKEKLDEFDSDVFDTLFD
jgi:hypothetical protein